MAIIPVSKKVISGLVGQSSTDRIGSVSAIPSGSSVDENMWNSNPYAGIDYRHTWWQKLLESIGIRTNYDAFKESMAINAKEYESQLLDKAHNEVYDSPVEQNARLRAAGVNPDLAGETSSGSSSPVEPDPNGPIAPSETDWQKVSGFANTIMGIFTTAVGFGKDALSLMQMKNAVESGNIENTKSLFDLGYRTAVNFIPATYPGENTDWVNQSSDLAFAQMSPFLNARQRKAFRNQISALYGSAPVQKEQWDSWLKNARGKIDTLTQYQSEFFGDGSDEVIANAARIIAKYSDRYIKAASHQSAISAENEVAYQENYDPALAASVENLTNERNRAGASIDGILNEALNEIIVDLRDRSESGKKGHQFASIALVLFSLFRMINFSQNHTKGVTPFGPVDTKSTNVGF